jgi:N-methylhydantoinase A
MAAVAGVDVGGTFTDVTLLDAETGHIWTAKTPSTPGDPSEGFLRGLEKAAAAAGISMSDLIRVFHGTTVATNAILQRLPARVGLITTAGFASVLEIGRHDIPRGENYWGWVKPQRPVTPEYIVEVPERVDKDGNVLVPLDEATARQAVRRLRELGVESIAVSLLYSFLFPEHERRIAAICAEEHPNALVSLSSEVLPQFREFERTMTTALNAYVAPHVARYFARLRRAGVGGWGLGVGESPGPQPPSLLIMKSSGGVMGAAEAARRGVHTALSGPAAGVIGAVRVAEAAGIADIVSIDVGGTSADVCLVRGGRPEITTEGAVGGFPIELPMVDIHTIGAGGGSIARVTAAGALMVGPESAGAEPGPACYGRGGAEPTVTDARLVLGHIPPALLGGEIALDVAAARAAVARVAERLGLSVEDAAAGIVAIADANMMGAVRAVSVSRGYDPRDFTLVAFGGAGPLHAVRLAELLEMPAVLVPPTPGVLSTLGLLSTDLRNDYVQGLHLRPPFDAAVVQAAFERLEREAGAWLTAEGVPPADRVLRRAADLHYVHQGHELTVDAPDGAVSDDALAAIVEAFHREHARLYTYDLRGQPVELVSVRVTATGRLPKAPLPELSPAALPAASAVVAERAVVWEQGGWPVATRCYARERLLPGMGFDGPAVVDQTDATTLVPAGWQAVVDRFGNLLIRRRALQD